MSPGFNVGKCLWVPKSHFISTNRYPYLRGTRTVLEGKIGHGPVHKGRLQAWHLRMPLPICVPKQFAATTSGRLAIQAGFEPALPELCSHPEGASVLPVPVLRHPLCIVNWTSEPKSSLCLLHFRSQSPNVLLTDNAFGNLFSSFSNRTVSISSSQSISKRISQFVDLLKITA